jgi:hypothetical protein
LYSSTDIIRQIKSRRMRWAGHLVRMGGEDRIWGFDGKSRRKRTTLKDQGVDGRMGSKWTLDSMVGMVWNGYTWLRRGIAGGLLWMRWWTFRFWRHGVSLIAIFAVGVRSHRVLIAVQRFGKHDSCNLQSKFDGKCSAYRNVGQLSAFDAA